MSLISLRASSADFATYPEQAERLLGEWVHANGSHLTKFSIDLVSDSQSLDSDASMALDYLMELRASRRKKSLIGIVVEPCDLRGVESFVRFAYWSIAASVFTDWSARPSFISGDTGQYAMYRLPPSEAQSLGAMARRMGYFPDSWSHSLAGLKG